MTTCLVSSSTTISLLRKCYSNAPRTSAWPLCPIHLWELAKRRGQQLVSWRYVTASCIASFGLISSLCCARKFARSKPTMLRSVVTLWRPNRWNTTWNWSHCHSCIKYDFEVKLRRDIVLLCSWLGAEAFDCWSPEIQEILWNRSCPFREYDWQTGETSFKQEYPNTRKSMSLYSLSEFVLIVSFVLWHLLVFKSYSTSCQSLSVWFYPIWRRDFTSNSTATTRLSTLESLRFCSFVLLFQVSRFVIIGWR